MTKHAPGPCKCRIVETPNRTSDYVDKQINYCPTHEAAPKMAKLIASAVDMKTGKKPYERAVQEWLDAADALLERIKEEAKVVEPFNG